MHSSSIFLFKGHNAIKKNCKTYLFIDNTTSGIALLCIYPNHFLFTEHNCSACETTVFLVINFVSLN